LDLPSEISKETVRLVVKMEEFCGSVVKEADNASVGAKSKKGFFDLLRFFKTLKGLKGQCEIAKIFPRFFHA
jgi:hypothetical protein